MRTDPKPGMPALPSERPKLPSSCRAAVNRYRQPATKSTVSCPSLAGPIRRRPGFEERVLGETPDRDGRSVGTVSFRGRHTARIPSEWPRTVDNTVGVGFDSSFDARGALSGFFSVRWRGRRVTPPAGGRRRAVPELRADAVAMRVERWRFGKRFSLPFHAPG